MKNRDDRYYREIQYISQEHFLSPENFNILES